MVVDTSALMGLLLGEPSASAIAEALEQDPDLMMSAATLVEVLMVAEARLGADGVLKLEQILREARIGVEPVDEADARRAIDAWRSFGRGRHPAGLNFGDCFAYALAARRGDTILCTGADFARTDLVTAP
ncbi:MAG TPA: type II toxin-antitoxin system VapC family toxin [Ilumatobacteraceae bacterium]|nr:type II toxin-antitoxin system VapC family toxin [Ilumatobacteraceae bacterium]